MKFNARDYLDTSSLPAEEASRGIAIMNAIANTVGDIPLGYLLTKPIDELVAENGIDVAELADAKAVVSVNAKDRPFQFVGPDGVVQKAAQETAEFVRVYGDLTYKDLFLKPRHLFTEEAHRAIISALASGLLPFILADNKCCDNDHPEAPCRDSSGKRCLHTPSGSCSISSDIC